MNMIKYTVFAPAITLLTGCSMMLPMQNSSPTIIAEGVETALFTKITTLLEARTMNKYLLLVRLKTILIAMPLIRLGKCSLLIITFLLSF